MKKPLLSTNNIWVAIGIALATAILSAAITALTLLSFEKAKAFTPILCAAVWLTGLICAILYIIKSFIRQKKRVLITTGVTYAIFLISILYYSAGFVYWIGLLMVMIIIFIANSILADSSPVLLFYNVNTLFSMSMAATFNGLMYARFISSDWGTLYLTLLSGLTFAAIGFILSVITLLTHTSYNSEKTP